VGGSGTIERECWGLDWEAKSTCHYCGSIFCPDCFCSNPEILGVAVVEKIPPYCLALTLSMKPILDFR